MLRARGLKRNLTLYPAFLVLIRSDFWGPIFFLYFASLFPLEEVLWLEAVYYFSAVLLEVPSGYFSDRFGRRPSLVLAALAGGLSGAIFFLTRSFALFAVAQFFFAVFWAFNSGSDTSFHFDTLAALGEEERFLELESSAHARSLAFSALASIGAGAAALWGFQWAYALSGLAFLGAAGVAFAFVEPPATGPAAEKTLLRQLGACRKRLKDPLLFWIFLYYVGRTIFEHIPYEFFQPYIGFVFQGPHLALWIGVHLALTRIVSAGFASRAEVLGRRWGTVGTLLLTHAVLTGLIASMALWVHPIVVLFLLLRNLPHGLGQPVMLSAIHKKLNSGLRATFLSFQSLVGRLAFSATLGAMAWTCGGATPTSESSLRLLTGVMAGLSALWLIVMAGGSVRVSGKQKVS